MQANSCRILLHHQKAFAHELPKDAVCSRCTKQAVSASMFVFPLHQKVMTSWVVLVQVSLSKGYLVCTFLTFREESC